MLETRPQGSKNTKKVIKNWKIHDSVWFSIAFWCFILELSTENKKNSWDKTFMKMWFWIFEKKLNFVLNVLKKGFLKAYFT